MHVEQFALSIVKRLTAAGRVAYFAGGWVRDYLRGIPAGDIDIATDATTDEICALFDKTVPVGVSFGVVVVVEGGHSFEVATFRRDLAYTDGRHPEGFERATPEEDAQRRDFTINGMFYDPLSQEVIDFVGGREDLNKHLLRTIGNPDARFTEDRLRMLRAVRFAVALDFALDAETERAISRHAHSLFPAVSIERVWQELTKMATDGDNFAKALCLMQKVGLLGVVFPSLSQTNIARLVVPFAYFPVPCPTLLYLLALFPDYEEADVETFADHFKITNKEGALGKLLVLGKQLAFDEKTRKWQWADYLAHPQSSLLIQVLAALRGDREAFLKRMALLRRELSFYIELLQQKKMLVTAALLHREGIEKGPLMGKLLKEAQHLAIEQSLKTPEDTLRALKKSALWP